MAYKLSYKLNPGMNKIHKLSIVIGCAFCPLFHHLLWSLILSQAWVWPGFFVYLRCGSSVTQDRTSRNLPCIRALFHCIIQPSSLSFACAVHYLLDDFGLYKKTFTSLYWRRSCAFRALSVISPSVNSIEPRCKRSQLIPKQPLVRLSNCEKAVCAQSHGRVDFPNLSSV